MNELTGADFKSATADDNKKLFIETYGCQINVADSEVIASVTVSYTHLILPSGVSSQASIMATFTFPMKP